MGGGVVGRPRWYFGQPQYRCPGARDYGFAEARLCSRNLRRAVTRHDGGVRRRSSEMLAIELYRPAVYAARTFDLLYVG